jgi:hypothetical protein
MDIIVKARHDCERGVADIETMSDLHSYMKKCLKESLKRKLDFEVKQVSPVKIVVSENQLRLRKSEAYDDCSCRHLSTGSPSLENDCIKTFVLRVCLTFLRKYKEILIIGEHTGGTCLQTTYAERSRAVADPAYR